MIPLKTHNGLEEFGVKTIVPLHYLAAKVYIEVQTTQNILVEVLSDSI